MLAVIICTIVSVLLLAGFVAVIVGAVATARDGIRAAVASDPFPLAVRRTGSRFVT